MSNRDEEHLALLADADSLSVLSRMGFDWHAGDRQLCAAVRFKRVAPTAGSPAPMVVALLGGASSGKSTLFNSLLGGEISRISAHAHETLGPIAAVHADRSDRFRAWLDDAMIFPGMEPADTQPGVAVAGRPDTVCVHRHEAAALRDVIVVDLPDVTSKTSADEGSLTRTLLPWFDGLIIVVDEERWFDAAVFDDLVAFSRNLGPSCWVVFNRTEQNEELSLEDQRRLTDHASDRLADDFCVSPFQAGAGYRPVADSVRERVVSWLARPVPRGRLAAMEHHLQRRCSAVLRENVARSEQYNELQQSVDKQLAELATETSLSVDLLTADERSLLGLAHRFVPLYDVIQSVRARLFGRHGSASMDDGGIDFDKRTDHLAQVLRRNLQVRFDHATHSIERIIAESDYRIGAGDEWAARWKLPTFDEQDWATRIRAHIDAWKAETQQQSSRGDLAALAVGTPLLLADLLFLGGAGITLTWAAAWVAGFFGGKGLMGMIQASPAYTDYQTTVRAYENLVRESLTDQCRENLATVPQRHLAMTDPILQAVLTRSTPGGR